MESNSICNHTSETKAQRESDLLITSMAADRIGRHEVFLSINHKKLQEKENSQVMKERKNLD